MSVLVEIRTRIENTGALIAQYESAIARAPEAAPPSLYANIRALESLLKRLDSEFNSIAQSEGLEVYRYRLLNEDDRPALVGVAEAWMNFQKFFGSVYTAVGKKSKGEKKKPQARVPELGYGYTFAASIGVVITLPREPLDLLGQSTLNDASDLVFDLIESKNLNEAARKLGPQPIEALHEWIDIHAKNHFGMALEWKSNNAIRRHAELGYEQLTALQGVIVKTETRSEMTVPGDLREVDYDAKTFRLRADDGKVIEGSFTDAITEEHTAVLPARYLATIVTTTQIIVLGKEPDTTIHLTKLAAL